MPLFIQWRHGGAAGLGFQSGEQVILYWTEYHFVVKPPVPSDMFSENVS